MQKFLGVNLNGIHLSADLGLSSNYSSEILEGRSRERFRNNSNWLRVSRS